MPLRLCLWPCCSFCQNVWVHCSQPLAHQLSSLLIHPRQNWEADGSCGQWNHAKSSGLFHLYQCSQFTVPCDQCFQACWGILTPDLLSRRATIKQIGSSLPLFRHTSNSTTARMLDAPSTGPVSPTSSSFNLFSLFWLLVSSASTRCPKGAAFSTKSHMLSCWFFKHKAVAYVPLARCSTLEAALTAISIFIVFGVPKSPYESTWKYEYDWYILIWWQRDACC